MYLRDDETSIRSNASRAYVIMRERIIRNEVPPGKKLNIAVLAAELAVSPGAMREALSRLTADNLVLAKDQRGFSVPPISMEELEDITQVRIMIETSALEQAMANADTRWLEEIRRAFKDLKYAVEPDGQSADAHAAFHEALVGRCGSPTLKRLRASLYLASERYRFFARNMATTRRDADAEHRAILDAVLQGDTNSAKALLADHIRRTSLFVREALASEANAPAPTSNANSLPRRKPAS
jgi:GntR family transcriptional regulator, carbon starvation induced regulator